MSYAHILYCLRSSGMYARCLQGSSKSGAAWVRGIEMVAPLVPCSEPSEMILPRRAAVLSDNPSFCPGPPEYQFVFVHPQVTWKAEMPETGTQKFGALQSCHVCHG